MKKPARTKRASTKQMLQMAVNLRRKFDCYTDIKVEACGHQRGRLEYQIYVAQYGKIKDYRLSHISWRELQDNYFRIMGGE